MTRESEDSMYAAFLANATNASPRPGTRCVLLLDATAVLHATHGDTVSAGAQLTWVAKKKESRQNAQEM